MEDVDTFGEPRMNVAGSLCFASGRIESAEWNSDEGRLFKVPSMCRANLSHVFSTRTIFPLLPRSTVSLNVSCGCNI